MAKGDPLTPHQKGIVRRYYDHQDDMVHQKLSETVSDLYLCTDEKKAARLWKSRITRTTTATRARVHGMKAGWRGGARRVIRSSQGGYRTDSLRVSWCGEHGERSLGQ